jgi:hypothetical protein
LCKLNDKNVEIKPLVESGDQLFEMYNKEAISNNEFGSIMISTSSNIYKVHLFPAKENVGSKY